MCVVCGEHVPLVPVQPDIKITGSTSELSGAEPGHHSALSKEYLCVCPSTCWPSAHHSNQTTSASVAYLHVKGVKEKQFKIKLKTRTIKKIVLQIVLGNSYNTIKIL